MGDGTEQNPYTREDVLRLIEENGGTAKGLDLSGKVFEKGIDLRGLDLEDIILNQAELRRAQLQGAELTRADLRQVHLEGAHLEKANLIFAHLEGAHLFNAYFEGAILIASHLEKANLWQAHLERASLYDAHLEKASLYYARIDGAILEHAYLDGACLLGAHLTNDTLLQDVHWGNYILWEERQELFHSAEGVYRQLKLWYKNAGISDIEGEFLFREMTAKRKQFWWGDKKEFSLKDSIRHFKLKELLRAIVPRKPFHWLLLMIYNLLCGYGERPLRVIGWAASVMVVSTLIYFLIGSVWEWSSFWNSLYFSAVSFTALGYGNWVNTTNDWIRGIGAFESFIGVFTIALFLITFVRKMTR